MGRGLRHSQVVTSGESVYIHRAPGNTGWPVPFGGLIEGKEGYFPLSLSLDNIRSLLSLSFSPLLAVLVCRSSGADYSSASLVDMSDGLMKPPHSFCS